MQLVIVQNKLICNNSSFLLHFYHLTVLILNLEKCVLYTRYKDCHEPLGFPCGSAVKNPPCDAGDTGDASLIPGLGRSPGGGNGNTPQYPCQENPMGCSP